MLIEELHAELLYAASCAKEAQRHGVDLPGFPETLRMLAGEALAISATRTGSWDDAALLDALRTLRRMRDALQLWSRVSGLMEEIAELIDHGRSCGLRSKCRTVQQAWRDLQAAVGSRCGSERAESNAAMERMLDLGIAGRPTHELRAELVRSCRRLDRRRRRRGGA